jgi:hypothetical protein
MTFAHFDTLGYVKLLVQAKFSQQQAEALNEAQIMTMKAVITQVATPADLQNLRLATQTDLQGLGYEVRAEIQELRNEMQELRSELLQEIRESRTRLQKEINKSIQYSMGLNIALFSLVIGLMALDL